MSAVNVMAEAAGFEVRDLENLGEHYTLTLRHWVNHVNQTLLAKMTREGKSYVPFSHADMYVPQ